MASLEQELEQRIARAVSAWQQQVTKPGVPLPVDEGWLQTPEALRMGFRVLKNAGIAPLEVELFNERASLRQLLAQATDPPHRQALQERLGRLEQALALRLEALRRLE